MVRFPTIPIVVVRSLQNQPHITLYFLNLPGGQLCMEAEYDALIST